MEGISKKYNNLFSTIGAKNIYNNEELKELLINEEYDKFFKLVDSIINYAVCAERNSYKYLVYEWKYISKEDAFQEIKLRIWNRIIGKKVINNNVVDCAKIDNYDNLGSFIFNAVKYTLQEARNKEMRRSSIASFSNIDDLDYLNDNSATPEQIYLLKEEKELKKSELKEVRESKKRFKSFRAFNQKTDECVGEFNTITDAASKLNCDKSHISAVLNGKRKSCKGFRFEYITAYNKEDYNSVEFEEKDTAKIIRIYDSGTLNLLSEFNSQKEIVNKFGCPSSNISAVLSGKRYSCNGLYFEYSA